MTKNNLEGRVVNNKHNDSYKSTSSKTGQKMDEYYEVFSAVTPVLMLKMALNFSKTVKRLTPWRTLVVLPIVLLVLQFIDAQNEAMKMKKALIKRLKFTGIPFHPRARSARRI